MPDRAGFSYKVRLQRNYHPQPSPLKHAQSWKEGLKVSSSILGLSKRFLSSLPTVILFIIFILRLLLCRAAGQKHCTRYRRTCLENILIANRVVAHSSSLLAILQQRSENTTHLNFCEVACFIFVTLGPSGSRGGLEFP